MLRSKPATGRAGTERIVERKEPGFDFINRETRDRAGEARREGNAFRVFAFLRIGIFDNGYAIGNTERDFKTVSQTIAKIVTHDDTINDHINVVLEFLVERRHLVNLIEGAVHLDALKTFLLQIGKFLAIFALTTADHWREQIKTGAFRQCQHAIDHLGHSLALNREARRWRIGNTDTRPEQAHIVVDFGDSADRRTRIARGRFLLDGDSGREPVDLIDIGLLHHLQKLPRICRKAFHIAPLAFGIDRIEGKRRLAGTRQACNHDELVSGQIDRDVLEVVFARTPNGQHLGITHLEGSRILAGGTHGDLEGSQKWITGKAA